MATATGGDGALVEIAETTRARRRSSISYAPPMVGKPGSTQPPRPHLVAGDHLARPHFLKERSATMRDSVILSAPANHGAQSKASAFLVRLVERSRTAGSFFESSSQNQQQAQTDQFTHRKSAIFGDAVDHSTLLTMLQNRQSSPAQTIPASAPKRPSVVGPSIRDLFSDDEYVTGYELIQKTPTDLVKDMTGYKRRVNALTSILHELYRRLQYAEMDSGDTAAPTAVELCKRLVDDGVLTSVVLVMREFLFDAELQTAAITLLSYVADISDLYAFLMVELDVEPLIQKIVSVHVSQERLVMLASSLFHTIAPCKNNAHVIKMHKARRADEEKRRASSFAQAFTAELSAAKMKAATARKLSKQSATEEAKEDEVRSGSRWKRGVLAGQLGAPPTLTAHYELSTVRRSTAIPPLSSSKMRPKTHDGGGGGGDEGMLQLEDAALLRPMTSPEPRSQQLSSLRLSPSAAKTAAIYSQSPLLIPSPQGRGRLRTSGRSKSSSAKKRIHDVRCGGGHVQERGVELTPHSPDQPHVDDDEEEENQSTPTESAGHSPPRSRSPTPQDDEPSYTDDEDFVADETGEISRPSSPGRLLPIGSDSELLGLVEDRESSPRQEQEQDDGDDEPLTTDRLLPTGSDGELLAMLETAQTEDGWASTPGSTMDTVSSEVVDLLSSCVDTTQDPATPLRIESPQLRYLGRTPTRRKPRVKKREPSSPLVASWTPPCTIVRPVSRRIMDKAAKNTKAAPRATSSPAAVAQITSVLESIDSPTSTDEGGEAPPSITVDSPATATCPSSTLSPMATTTSSIAQIQAQYARGLVHHKANELDAAIRCYEAGIALQRSSDGSGGTRQFASLYINVGSAYLALRRLDDAVTAFSEAERIQPQNTKALFNSGLALMQLGRWEDAIAKLEAVVAIDPAHTRAQCGLDECRRHLSE